MVSVFDQRIVQVSIEFESGIQTFEGLSIYASGQKFDAALYNQCEFRIYNLTQNQRNYIISQTSPLNPNRQNVKVFLDVGRASYGTFRLFEGGVWAGGITQPPDIGIVLTAITNNFATGVILGNTQSSIAQLSTVARSIADGNGLILDFQATDKQIDNFSYNGAAAFQLNSLNDIGGIVASVDNGVLTVRNAGTPIMGQSRLINAETGMVGIPQFTQNGVSVKMMIDNTIRLGQSITIESKIVPVVNGNYIVQQIFFEVASRDQQFWYTLNCIAPAYYAGTIS